MTSIIGWDLANGAGERAKPLVGTAKPDEIRLFGVQQSPGELPGEPTAGQLYPVPAMPDWGTIPGVVNLDVFNLDPRLTLVLHCYHQRMRNCPPGTQYPIANLPGTISARALVRSHNPAEGDIELFELPDLWQNSGNIGDGCEIVSGMQGIRFRVALTQAELQVQHDVVATLIAIPNASLGCIELARAIINRLEVRIPKPFDFMAYTFE